eukprot:gnl/Trimastix_PCT/1884.p2 GENE.gnl/Trimastix_PCT/1884~~gnl/Trimastix_PCT/1884.p2  ORF type:complete len:437 (-),score=94.72 gnl/Trimastix_PCT/1884:128-1438(-)
MASSAPTHPVSVVIGAQWGDEGKGKLVDYLVPQFDLCARFNGGSNAGHSVVKDGIKFATHLLPSGILTPSCHNLIGNGVVIHFPTLFHELEDISSKGVQWEGRLFFSSRAHVLFNFHQTVDGMAEDRATQGSKIGTTRRGIGPCYSHKAMRTGLRVHDLYLPEDAFRVKLQRLVNIAQATYGSFDFDMDAEIAYYSNIAEKIRPYVVDGPSHLYKLRTQQGKRILAEGANAIMLDLDFGTYPFVTSSSTSVGGVCTGLGLPPNCLGEIYGVLKAYETRVGEGPFPTELFDATGQALRDIGHEYGTTTGRPRRCGWLDLVQAKFSQTITGFTAFNLTKLDCLSELPELKLGVGYRVTQLDGTIEEIDYFPADLNVFERLEVVYETFPGWQCDISQARRFEDLPTNAQRFVNRIEEYLNVPIKFIGVGASTESMIIRE